MDFTLRGFESHDFEVLWRIDQECFPPGISYSRADLSAYVQARRGFTLIAEERAGKLSKTDGCTAPSRKILGFIIADANRKGVGHIITIDVLPEGRRFGIGSRLLAAAEERLRSANCTRIKLEAAVDNVPALAFYKRHRYEPVKIISGYYSNGIDAWVLEKALAQW